MQERSGRAQGRRWPSRSCPCGGRRQYNVYTERERSRSIPVRVGAPGILILANGLAHRRLGEGSGEGNLSAVSGARGAWGWDCLQEQ